MAELSKAIARLMEERERAQPQAVVADPPKLRDVLEAARGKLAPGERPLIESFIRQLFDKAGADVLDTGAVSELAAIAVTGCRFLLERNLQEPHVRVFDPDLTNHGWEASCTVVQSVMRDRPFIIDTIRDCLRESGCGIRRLLHPVLAVERDPRGTVLAIHAPGALGRKESFVHVEVDRVPDPEALMGALMERLGDVVLVTDDYPALRARAEAVADELRTRVLPAPWNADIDEIAAFLDWLGQKNFVFLGYREYQFAGHGTERTGVVRRRSGLGVLRKEERSTLATPQVLPEALRRRLNEPPLLIVSKTNALSTIHRRAPMDYVGIKEIDASGIVAGERRFLGLFTSKAYAEEPTAVPLLRRKLAAILDAEGATEDAHDYKAIVTVFNSMPKVELLATSVSELRATIKTIRAAEGTPGSSATAVKLVHRSDALGRGVFVVVILPKERFSQELFRRIETRLAQTLSATGLLEQRLAMDESDQVRMHFYFAAAAENARAVSSDDLCAQVSSLLRTWDDRLRDLLREHFPREHARLVGDRYTAAFSNEYKAATDVAPALRDIRALEALLETRSPQVDLTNDDATGLGDSEARYTAIKLYLSGERLVLSDFLPVLEHLGLKVFAQDPLDVTLPQLGRVHLHTFLVQDTAGARLDVDEIAPLLRPALLALHAGRAESDRLNALIATAGLHWQQVDLLRTYVNYGLQIGAAASREALIGALVNAPESARLLWEYFQAKLDPLRPAAPRDRLADTLPAIEQRFIASLDTVQNGVDDRILRVLFSAIAATVRTNFFRSQNEATDSTAARPAVSVKIECARVSHLPRPLPAYEVYVHAPHVEAIHLRGAKVARGGIRLSDRPDDFRTEVLDLMATQMVKNAVIIPAGAKGGFVPKRPAGAPLTSGQVIAAYQTFIGALLELTDNIVDGRLVAPVGMLAYDEPDPYLVVAADKGTAAFSDIANEVAAQHRFWLGDAFASGGTHGYDHKKEGITARGAWECVRRHFREMGRDANRDTLTVIGIGDMSGDVFGNGLLMSRRMRLRAAFNHQHIFLDPDPDPARSFAERERLFHRPRSTWMDYNTAIITEGGGVFPRQAKKVPLSEPAQQMLGIEADSASGEEVVRAILRMEADLLWNGGVGTYVKASDETHADVGDSSNDLVRVNGADLRAKVVAEGGNLGCTQRGRVEYALHGGRINTDAIDNSGGVDMSDHEVNLKITLAPLVSGGDLSVEARNQILTDLAPEVTRRVLAHNLRQARILSLDQLRSQAHLAEFRELMLQLEAEGHLDRHLEGLPDRDILRDRRPTFLGLTRPELAVLLARSKLAVQRCLVESDLPDDPFFERHLRAYFPEAINTQFGGFVRSHRLRREIIAVETANELIDTMGAAFVNRVARDTGCDAAVVVRAWEVAMAVSGATDVWTELGEAEPPLPLAAEARCWFALQAAIERATKWIIETQPSHGSTGDVIATLKEPTQELLNALPSALPPMAQRSLVAMDALTADGTPRALAQRIVPLDRLAELFEITQIAENVELPRSSVAEVYYRVGDVVDLDWVRQSLGNLPAEGRWERRATEGLHEGLVYARRQITHNVLLCRQGGGQVDECLREYIDGHQEELTKLRVLIDDIKSAPHATLAALLVVVRELGRLVGRPG